MTPLREALKVLGITSQRPSELNAIGWDAIEAMDIKDAEIARLRDLLERVEEVFENRPHSDACGCDKCEIYAAVCRVNKETP